MTFRLIACRISTGLVLAGCIFAVAGCQSGDLRSHLNLGATGAPPPPSAQVSQADITAYCPNIMLRAGTAYYNEYGKVRPKRKKVVAANSEFSFERTVRGGSADSGQTTGDKADNLIYQAAITDVSRACHTANGVLTMDVGVAGKVVPGPLAKAGPVTMPIRVAVRQGDSVVYSKLFPYKVQISDASQATQFLFTDPGIAIPVPTARNVMIYAGYDQGPPDKSGKKK